MIRRVDEVPKHPDEVTRVDGPGAQPVSEAIMAPGNSRTRMKHMPAPMPARIGRFMIVRKLGEGGMGVVFYAYDPQLDRSVALKILRPAMRRDTNSQGEARLLREAQAMARLSHPNVVQVFEAGEVEEAVYLAMEYVEGHDLRTWLGIRERSWREIVAVFLQAGQGLAAAHAAGVIHRDFKPDNVLVGDDGRARVLDFGLARPADGDETEEYIADGAAHSSHKITLTKVGAYIGTPAYMSPEQHLSQPADARSDQFSYCVALYEALHGHRPFHGKNAAEVRLAVFRGIQAAPSDRKIPKHLRQIVNRGLSTEADQRFVSMRALLAALAVDPARTHRRVAIGVATLTLGAAGAIGSGLWAEEQRCQHGVVSVGPVWNDARAQRVQAAFLATGLSYAAQTWPKVQAELDLYATTWARQRDEFCAATHVLGEASAELLDRRNACLDDCLRDLDALIGALETADGATVERAIQSTASLKPLASCRHAVAVGERVRPPADVELAAAVARARSLLASAAARRDAGRPRESREIATAVGRSSDELNYPPLRAEALLELGRSEEATADYDLARTHLTDAYHLALGIRHDAVATDAAITLSFVHHRMNHGPEAFAWSEHARSLLQRTGERPEQRVPYLLYRSYALTRLGLHVDATRAAEEALALAEQHFPRGDPRIGRMLAGVAHAYWSRGDSDAALALFRRSQDAWRAGLSPDHPAVASSGINISTIHLHRHEFAAALAALLPALTTMERSFGSDHPSVADALTNLGAVADGQGRLAEAVAATERAAAIYARRLGADSHMAVATLIDLGDQQGRLGRQETALCNLRRARSTLRQSGGQPELLAMSERLIGDVLAEQRRSDEAEVSYRSALETLGPAATTDARAPALRGLARLARERGDATQAEALARSALVPTDPEVSADDIHPIASERAATLIELGEAELALGRIDEALAHCSEAVALEDLSHGPDSTQSAMGLLCLGRAEQARGSPAAARVALERAAAILGAGELARHVKAAAHEALARVLLVDEPERARELAQQAAAGYLAAGAGHVADLARVNELRAPPPRRAPGAGDKLP